MSDLFISYASEDRARIVPFVNALKQEGWAVWWDRKISIGSRYDQEIRQALDEAKCVVVVWTKASVESDWVKDEASRATDQNKLFPARLDDVEPPLGFGMLQTANLVDWDATQSHKEFTKLVQSLHKKCPSRTLPHPVQVEILPEHPTLLQKSWPLLVLGALPIIFGLVVLLTHVNKAEVNLQASVSEFSFVSNSQQELSDPISITSLKAAGLSRIELPNASEFPSESLTENEGLLGTIVVRPSGKSEHQGNITLDTITLSAGNALRVVKASIPYQYKLTLDHPDRPMRINVTGPVDIVIPGIGTKSHVFSFPKSLLLQAGQTGLDIEITTPSPSDNLLPALLSVTNLEFIRIDERRGYEQTTVRRVSTLLSGEYSLNGEQQQLASGGYLQFSRSEGSLSMIRLNHDNLDVEFQGSVEGMKSCQAKSQCTSLMPTYWEWLMSHYGTLIMIGGVLYYFLISLGGWQWWKRQTSNQKK